MLKLLQRTYLTIFRRYPVLGRIALVAAVAEVLFASLNYYALPFYVLDELAASGALARPGRTLGILISTFLIAEMVLKLPFGHLSDRYGRRVFAAAGLAVCAITPLVICAVPTEVLAATPVLIYVLLGPLRVLDGAGAAALWPPLFAAVPDNVPSEDRGSAMSVINVAYFAGIAVGPLLAGMAMRLSGAAGGSDEWTAKAPFAFAACAAVCGALVARRLPRAPGIRKTAAETGRRGRAATRVIAVVLVITFSQMFAVATLGPYLGPYVRAVTDIPRSDVGFLLLLLFIPAALLGIPIGRLTDRLAKRRVVQAAVLSSALGLWCVPSCQSLWPMMMAGVVVVLGFLFGVPAWLALIADLAPEGRSGRTMGLMATAQGVGAFLGPLAGGSLWDASIHYPWYASAGALTLAGLTALLFVRGGEARSSRPAKFNAGADGEVDAKKRWGAAGTEQPEGLSGPRQRKAKSA